MRYAVPVNAPEEVAALAAAGAGELYCGYQDAWWVERYGDHDSASRRQGAANLSSLDDLERCATEAQVSGLPLWLALNSRYTEPQLDHLVELCQQFEYDNYAHVCSSWFNDPMFYKDDGSYDYKSSYWFFPAE